MHASIGADNDLTASCQRSVDGALTRRRIVQRALDVDRGAAGRDVGGDADARALCARGAGEQRERARIVDSEGLREGPGRNRETGGEVERVLRDARERIAGKIS